MLRSNLLREARSLVRKVSSSAASGELRHRRTPVRMAATVRLGLRARRHLTLEPRLSIRDSAWYFPWGFQGSGPLRLPAIDDPGCSSTNLYLSPTLVSPNPATVLRPP